MCRGIDIWGWEVWFWSKKCGVVLIKSPYVQVWNSQTIKKNNKLDAPSFSRWEFVLVIPLKLDTLVWSPLEQGIGFLGMGLSHEPPFFLESKPHQFSCVCNRKGQAGLEGIDLLAEGSTGSQLVTSDSYLLTSTSSSNGRWSRSIWWRTSCRLLVHRLESRYFFWYWGKRT